MTTKSNPSTPIGFIGLLTIVFITLKLLGLLNWSWWWVLSPLWGFVVGVTLVLLIVVISWGRGSDDHGVR